MSAPPIADGIVSYHEGRITYVGTHDGRRIDRRFDDAILLPGLVNAHTHLDLTGARGLTPPQPDFCAWLKSIIEYRKMRSSAQVQRDIASGVGNCIAAGTTLVGDIASTRYDYGALHVVAFQELIGLGEDRCDAAIESWQATGFVPVGVSPHAPYSFRFDRLEKLPAHCPLTMHLAESRDEVELIQFHSGRMREFLDGIGAWCESGLAASNDTILAKLAKRSSPPLLVHCNYLSGDAPIPAGATIVYCPRTHAAFGHPAHPFREFMARGIRVVLGTDSLASNPDLSVLNEGRFVMRHFPDVDASLILHMMTDWSAMALGESDRCGTLHSGKRADFCIVAIAKKTADPIGDLFHSDAPILATYIAGANLAADSLRIKI